MYLRKRGSVAHLEDTEHGLYRVYGAWRLLLYVGISADPDTRLRDHRARARWWPLMESVRVDLYPGRRAALAAENNTIRMEHPVYNTTGSVCRCGGSCGVCAFAAGELGGYGPLRP